MTPKHTLGPWTALSRSVVAEDGLSICELPKRSRVMLGAHGLREQEAIDPANLRLIASAPALLEALQDAVSTQPADSPIRWVLRARAAIAKATGESK